MITTTDVLNYLLPNGGWVLYGDDFDSIIYDEGIEPIELSHFEATKINLQTIKEQEAATKAAARQAVLEKLGLSAEDIAALGL
jgi:hypothetical protein